MSQVLGRRQTDIFEPGEILIDIIPRIEKYIMTGLINGESENSTQEIEVESEANGLEPDFVAIDEFQDLVKEGEPFEFECYARHKTDEGCWYIVHALEEYDNLDFQGHTVMINGRERLCGKFEVSEDGTLSILVRNNAGTQS